MKKIRGFEKLNEEAILPKRQTARSAGYDFSSPIDADIPPQEIVKIKTGICAYMQNDEFLAIYIRSSLGIKYNLSLANNVGIIDSDYYHNPDNNGEIIIAIRNNSNSLYHISKGDRIAQGIFQKYLVIDGDDAKGTRTGGIGSTNK